MQLAISTSARGVAVAVIATLAFWSGAAETHAAVDSLSYELAGPGLANPGRELSASISLSNGATDSALTPELISRVSISSKTIRFNGGANGLATCRASLPTNGDPVKCPSRSKVGSGTIRGILGTPGMPADEFGVLSAVVGRFTLFNYQRRGGDSARLVAVISAVKPFRGVAINLVAPISRAGVLTIDIPELKELPRLIRRSYPRGTKLVLTKLKADIFAPRKQRSKPFMWLRSPKYLGLQIEAEG